MYIQKQPPEVLCKKKCSVKKRVRVPKILQYSQEKTCLGVFFYTKRLQNRCFRVDIAKLSTASILTKICECLLLYLFFWHTYYSLSFKHTHDSVKLIRKVIKRAANGLVVQ